jgi:hypothetical protein
MDLNALLAVHVAADAFVIPNPRRSVTAGSRFAGDARVDVAV